MNTSLNFKCLELMKKIQENEFNEDDISSLLINIRELLPNNFIKEIANIIAHPQQVKEGLIKKRLDLINLQFQNKKEKLNLVEISKGNFEIILNGLDSFDQNFFNKNLKVNKLKFKQDIKSRYSEKTSKMMMLKVIDKNTLLLVDKLRFLLESVCLIPIQNQISLLKDIEFSLNHVFKKSNFKIRNGLVKKNLILCLFYKLHEAFIKSNNIDTTLRLGIYSDDHKNVDLYKNGYLTLNVDSSNREININFIFIILEANILVKDAFEMNDQDVLDLKEIHWWLYTYYDGIFLKRNNIGEIKILSLSEIK